VVSDKENNKEKKIKTFQKEERTGKGALQSKKIE